MRNFFAAAVIILSTAHASAFHPPSDSNTGGSLLFCSLSFETAANADCKLYTLDILELSPGSTPHISPHFGLITQFSPDVNVLDLYVNFGITVYPLKKMFSFSADFAFNYFWMILNHLSYLAGIKANVDLPLYEGHKLTLGIGLRRRDAVRLFDYLQLGKDYYELYDSRFFEIGYRYVIE